MKKSIIVLAVLVCLTLNGCSENSAHSSERASVSALDSSATEAHIVSSQSADEQSEESAFSTDEPSSEPEKSLEQIHGVPVGYVYKKGYHYISYPSNGLILARKDGKYGYLLCEEYQDPGPEILPEGGWENYLRETDFPVAIPFDYDFADDFYQEGYAIVEVDGKVGCINKSNEVIIPLEYVSGGAASLGGWVAMNTLDYEVWESEEPTREPAYRLRQYDLFRIQDGVAAFVYHSDYIVKDWPIVDSNHNIIVPKNPVTTPVDINGKWSHFHTWGKFYKGVEWGQYHDLPVFDVVEWDENTEYRIIDVSKTQTGQSTEDTYNEHYDYVYLIDAAGTGAPVKVRDGDTFLGLLVSDEWDGYDRPLDQNTRYTEHYRNGEVEGISYYTRFRGQIEVTGVYSYRTYAPSFFTVSDESKTRFPVFYHEYFNTQAVVFETNISDDLLKAAGLWQDLEEYEVRCTVVIEELVLRSFYQSGAGPIANVISVR